MDLIYLSLIDPALKEEIFGPVLSIFYVKTREVGDTDRTFVRLCLKTHENRRRRLPLRTLILTAMLPACTRRWESMRIGSLSDSALPWYKSFVP